MKKNEILYKKNQIKLRALNTNERPRDIIVKYMGINNYILKNENIMTKSLNDLITATRKKHNINIIKDDIPENIKYTYANELFLQFDSGSSSTERYLIFTTDTHLQHLKHSELWFCDGTFRSCPKKFS
ncbi:hypothetical protein DMUE_0457 [Dictyocoela muelleri]|nr:hypothetical protein DMUE_0457 [Dictyocoela muelleri]